MRFFRHACTQTMRIYSRLLHQAHLGRSPSWFLALAACVIDGIASDKLPTDKLLGCGLAAWHAAVERMAPSPPTARVLAALGAPEVENPLRGTSPPTR